MKNLLIVLLVGLMPLCYGAKFAIIKDSKVINIIEADAANANTIAASLGATAVRSDAAGIGQSCVNGVFSATDLTAEKNAAALAKNKFTKLQIRRALRVLGQESALDILLTNDAFRKDWADAIEIDLNDTLTKQALTSLNVDVNAVKIAISNLE